MKLGLKLPAVVLCAVALAGSVGGALVVHTVEGSMRTEAIDAARREVSAYASSLDLFLTFDKSAVEVAARRGAVSGYSVTGRRDPAVHGVPALAAPVARQALDDAMGMTSEATPAATGRGFEYMMIIDPHAQIFLVEPYALQAAASGDNVGFLAWYQRVLATGRPVISDLHISPVTQSPSVVVAAPIRDAQNRVVGVLAGAIRLAAFSEVAKVTNAHASSHYGYVTDSRGLVVAHQGNPEYVRYQTDFSSAPPSRGRWLGARARANGSIPSRISSSSAPTQPCHHRAGRLCTRRRRPRRWHQARNSPSESQSEWCSCRSCSPPSCLCLYAAL